MVAENLAAAGHLLHYRHTVSNKLVACRIEQPEKKD